MNSSEVATGTDDVVQDVVFEHMQTICDTYQAIKEQLQRALERIRQLELENTTLKSTIDDLQSARQRQSPKRRKTESPRQKPADSLANSSTANESHADEFNMAIQNVSTDGDGDAHSEPPDAGDTTADDEDEEEISATPVMQSTIKRERTKLSTASKDSKSQLKIAVAAVTATNATQTLCQGRMSSPAVAARQVKHEPANTGIIHASPLRDCNRPVNTTKRPVVKALMLNFGRDVGVDASLGFVEVRARRGKDTSRKVLSLSSSKVRMKQSVLGFSPTTLNTAAPREDGVCKDPDETYFDDDLPANRFKTNAKNKTLRRKPLTFAATTTAAAAADDDDPFGTDDDDLFNFADKPPVHVKPELSTQKRDRPTVANVSHTLPDDRSNSSSVFALPTQTDEIIMIDETPPMFLGSPLCMDSSPPAVKAKVMAEGVVDAVATVIRTEYKQPVSLRTIKEKEAQPGFMCPDCAPWFKFMGAKLSDRDIQKRLDACSRHRQDVRELPSTPEGFWVPYFEDTQQQQPATPMDDGQQPALIDYRLRNRQQVLDESMNY